MNGEMRPLVAAVKSLVDAFPHRNVSDDTLMQYVEDLEDLPEPLVVEAIKRLRRSSTFLPTIAEIRGLVIDAVTPAIGPDEAWSEVLRHINSRSTEPFSHPAIGIAVRTVGWDRIREDEMKFTRPDFYKALAAANVRVRTDMQDGSVAIEQGTPFAFLPERSNGR